MCRPFLVSFLKWAQSDENLCSEEGVQVRGNHYPPIQVLENSDGTSTTFPSRLETQDRPGEDPKPWKKGDVRVTGVEELTGG